MAKTTKHVISYTVRVDPKDAVRKLNKVEKELDDLSRPRRTPLSIPGRGGAGGGRGGGGTTILPGGGGGGRGGVLGAGRAAGGAALAGMGRLFAGLAAGYGLTRFTRSMIKSTEQMDKWRREFTHLYQDSDKGAKILNEAMDLANMTTLDLNAVIQARKQMKLFGIEGADNLKAFAGAAETTGISINALVEAVGRIRFGGASTAMRTLRRLGIGPVELRAKGIVIEGQQIKSNANEVFQAVSEIMKEKFSGAVDASAETFRSKYGTLQVQWMRLQEQMGKELLPALGAQVDKITEFVDRLSGVIKAGREEGKGVLESLGGEIPIVKDLQNLLKDIPGFNVGKDSRLEGDIAAGRGDLYQAYVDAGERLRELKKADRLEPDWTKLGKEIKAQIKALERNRETLERHLVKGEMPLASELETERRGRIKAREEETHHRDWGKFVAEAPALPMTPQRMAQMRRDRAVMENMRRREMNAFNRTFGGRAPAQQPIQQVDNRQMNDQRTINNYGIPTPQMSGVAAQAGMQ